MKILNLAVIRLDGGTQARIALDNDKVGEYAEAMKEGHKFPPITTFYDGSDYWLADGFHRYHATRQTGAVSIEANAITGTVEEAQIYAFGANAKRGLSTTQEDNRSIITRMLSHPISSSWTNAEIARHVGVSSMTVGRVKASLEKSTDTQEEPKTQKTYTRNGKQVEGTSSTQVTFADLSDDEIVAEPIVHSLGGVSRNETSHGSSRTSTGDSGAEM